VGQYMPDVDTAADAIAGSGPAHVLDATITEPWKHKRCRRPHIVHWQEKAHTPSEPSLGAGTLGRVLKVLFACVSFRRRAKAGEGEFVCP